MGGSFMKSNTFIVIFLLIWVVLQMHFANVKKVVSSKALRMSNVASPDHYWKSTEIPKLLNEYFKDRETSNMADMLTNAKKSSTFFPCLSWLPFSCLLLRFQFDSNFLIHQKYLSLLQEPFVYFLVPQIPVWYQVTVRETWRYAYNGGFARLCTELLSDICKVFWKNSSFCYTTRFVLFCTVCCILH